MSIMFWVLDDRSNKRLQSGWNLTDTVWLMDGLTDRPTDNSLTEERID